MSVQQVSLSCVCECVSLYVLRVGQCGAGIGEFNLQPFSFWCVCAACGTF